MNNDYNLKQLSLEIITRFLNNFTVTMDQEQMSLMVIISGDNYDEQKSVFLIITKSELCFVSNITNTRLLYYIS